MRLELEVRTITEDDPVILGAEINNEFLSGKNDIEIMLNAIRSGIKNKNWTSFVAKVYF